MRAKAQPSGRQLEAWKGTTKSQPIANGRFAHKRPFAATFRNGSKWSATASSERGVVGLSGRSAPRQETSGYADTGHSLIRLSPFYKVRAVG